MVTGREKELIIINGPMGVGKSAVAQELSHILGRSVWLDGDWCWKMDPFLADEESRRMVEDNIIHLLRNFLAHSAFEHVIFSWVIPDEKIFAILLDGLEGSAFRLHKITLLASEQALAQRIGRDMDAGRRDEGALARSLDYLSRYPGMDTEQIDTDGLTPAAVAEKIAGLIAR